MKILPYLLIAFICFSTLTIFAQNSYPIYDIVHEIPYVVQIREKPEYSEVILFLQDSNKHVMDSLTISDVTGITDVSILKDTFVSITFSRRAGSGVKVRFTKLISAKEEKLFESLFLFTTNSFRMKKTFEDEVDNATPIDEKSIYEIKLSLQGSSYTEFKLFLEESSFVFSTIDPSANEDWKKTFVLNFDFQKMVFSNGRTVLAGSFIYRYGVVEKELVFQNEEVPEITLIKQHYLYVNNSWCAQRDNCLIKM